MSFLRNLQNHIKPQHGLPSSEKTNTRPSPTRRNNRFSLLRTRVQFKKISIPLGIVLVFPCIVIITIMIMILRQNSSEGPETLPKGAPTKMRKISDKYDRVFHNGCLDPERESKAPRVNGAFVVLARNKELDGVISSIRSIERHFNRWFHYPYVFLNDGDFNSTFKEVVRNYTSGTVEFGKLDPSMWGYPDWVDKENAREGIRAQGDRAIMYGDMESYHHMCRFYSGFFYKHPLLDKYKWYWRLEPDIKYFCDITYDPFAEMERHNKTYGFTIAIKELRETVPNIFRYASAYKRVNNITATSLWNMFIEKPKKDKKLHGANVKKPLPVEILTAKAGQGNLDEIDPNSMEGESYNMCHYWSNFEIARLDWFRSKEYNDFFSMMDHSGGFWMERWGDAPIHSLAAGLLLDVKDVHYFRDFGYRHTTIQHCPANAPARQLPRIPFLEPQVSSAKKRRDDDEYWDKWDAEQDNGVGCRCRCDTDIVDVEGKEGSCLAEWVDVAGGWASP